MQAHLRFSWKHRKHHHTFLHITSKGFLHLVFPHSVHAWIHKNTCNRSLHAGYFYFSGDHTCPLPHSSSAFHSTLCHGHVNTQTHTFPQAPATNAHTTAHWQRHFRHDAKALRGHLPVSQPCQPNVLQGKQLMLQIIRHTSWTHTRTNPSCIFMRAWTSEERWSWTKTATLFPTNVYVLPSAIYISWI